MKVTKKIKKLGISEGDSISESTSLSNGHNYFHTSFTLIRYSFGFQIVLHLITFLLNSVSYRHLDAASLGLVNVRVGLYYSTLVFVAREAFRYACLSRGGQLVNEHKQIREAYEKLDNECSHTENGLDQLYIQKCRVFRYKFIGLLNLIWLVLPFGILISLLLGFIWLRVLPSPNSLASEPTIEETHLSNIDYEYSICILVYTLSAFMELATEPFWLVCQLGHFVRGRIFIEALANLFRAFGIVFAILNFSPKYAIYSLALPQILHGLTLFLAYFFHFLFVLNREGELGTICEIHNLKDFLPNYINYPIDQPGLMLARNFFGQILLKQLLTEGERYLISMFHLITFTEQGIYDLVSNLGSLAARLLFLPLEESCHFIFGQCLQRDIAPNEQNKHLLINVIRIFRTALHVSSLVAWIGVIFSQTNSRLLLTLYIGPQMTENVTSVNLLRLYSVYVLLLAWNGSTEAFLCASMSTNEVLWHNNNLLAFSVVFLAANWIFVPRFGVYGFILANSINMIARILYSLYYIKNYIKKIHEPSGKKSNEIERKRNEKIFGSNFSPIKLMFPSWCQCFMFFISLIFTSVSEQYFCCNFGVQWMGLHIVITTGFLIACLLVIYRQESSLISLVRSGLLNTKTD